MRIKNLKAVLALTLAVALVTPAAAVSAPVTVTQAATKTYKCTVTVKNPKKAAGMKDMQVGPVNICYPGEWNKEVVSEGSTFAFAACDGENTSNSMNIVEFALTPEDGSTIDDYYAMYSEITEEYLLSVLEMQGMEDGKVLQYSVEKCDTKFGETVMLKQRISYYYPATEKNYDEAKVTYIFNFGGNAYVMFAANEEGDFEAAQANVDKLLETMTQL